MKEEIRYSPRELDKHYKEKEGVFEEDKEEEEEFNFEERLEENEKLYYREIMRERRNNTQKDKQINNKKPKKEAPTQPKPVKAKSPRYDYHKKNTYGIEEPKIKDLRNFLTDLKKYPADFPREEFNKRLDEIIKNNSSEILGKTLKDIIYDILDKKGILTGEKILNIYYDSIWGKAIEDFMNAREYFGEMVEKDILYKRKTEETRK